MESWSNWWIRLNEQLEYFSSPESSDSVCSSPWLSHSIGPIEPATGPSSPACPRSDSEKKYFLHQQHLQNQNTQLSLGYMFSLKHHFTKSRFYKEFRKYAAVNANYLSTLSESVDFDILMKHCFTRIIGTSKYHFWPTCALTYPVTPSRSSCGVIVWPWTDTVVHEPFSTTVSPPPPLSYWPTGDNSRHPSCITPHGSADKVVLMQNQFIYHTSLPYSLNYRTLLETAQRNPATYTHESAEEIVWMKNQFLCSTYRIPLYRTFSAFFHVLTNGIRGSVSESTSWIVGPIWNIYIFNVVPKLNLFHLHCALYTLRETSTF